jgi:hypothetical protein
MTTGKATAWILGLVGVIVLGIWVAPNIANRASSPTTVSETATSVPEEPIAAPAKPARSKPAAQPSAAPEAAGRTATAAPNLPKLSPQTPELLDRLQPLLNKGADMKIASEGFRDAELFASVAHAAKNTEVPFVLLKHRVLREGMTLDRAIAELKPKADAAVEADRARAEARSDIASLANAL